jgi:dipeptidyl aminopeptidase/acylaminoacyl peptidase
LEEATIMKQPFRSLFCLSVLLALVGSVPGQTRAASEITIEREGVVLKGKFHAAAGQGPFATVILLHGFPGNETDVLGLGGRLSAQGINVLTFNYSGTFGSGGLDSFTHTLEDIGAAFAFIHRAETISAYGIDTTRVFLGGWSYGGGMALTYAALHPDVRAVFSIAGTDHGEFMREYERNPEFAKTMDEGFVSLAAPDGPVRFDKGGPPKEIAAIGIEHIEPALDLRKSAPLLAPKRILLIAGWDDPNVTVDHHILPFYRALQEAQAQNVRLVAFQDDHAFKKSRADIAQVVRDWIAATPKD